VFCAICHMSYHALYLFVARYDCVVATSPYLRQLKICTLNRALLRKYTALLRKFMHIHSTGPQNRTGEGSFAEDMYIE